MTLAKVKLVTSNDRGQKAHDLNHLADFCFLKSNNPCIATQALPKFCLGFFEEGPFGKKFQQKNPTPKQLNLGVISTP